MLPAYLYTPLYFHAMLLVVVSCTLVYWAGRDQSRSLDHFNRVAMIVIGLSVLLFIGFRPVSGVFVDMVEYARTYERVQQGVQTGLKDWLFNGLMRLCSLLLPAGGFFFVCALIYVAPLAVAFLRIHGAWAFPVFLACLTAFSFWAYAVNGIRNGMATSVLILAFAFHAKPVVMLPLMAVAHGLHGSVMLPAAAFLIVRYVKWTEIWLAFWLACVAVSLFAGNVGQMLLSLYNPFTWDERVETYILGSQSRGFRADFLAYSILPVVVTLLMAAPTRARSRRFVGRVKNGPVMNWMWRQSTMKAKPMGIGGQLCLQGVSAAGNVASVVVRHPLPDPHTSSERACRKWVGRDLSMPGAGVSESGWNRLPWVRLLRRDPFYARLVNTYLLSNALWALLIHANFSNRFAYLSWFMMPWILLYPFVPGEIIHRPRIGFIAAILCVHYLFTYVMWVGVYRMSFG
jgi:hypothetical protein